MTDAFLNRIATAVPPHEAHAAFLRFAKRQLGADSTRGRLFARMAGRGGVEMRYCCLQPADGDGDWLDAEGRFRRGAFPGTGERMRLYEQHAPALAAEAVAQLNPGPELPAITHLIVTSCTGFFAPGVDLEIVKRCGLRDSVERTIVGFMGCYAAVNALKLARHIVRSEPDARVLIVNLELCTLHINETETLEELLTFYLWGDGCAASLVSAQPEGFRLDSFHAIVADETSELMQWAIRDRGFDMVLSGSVPAMIGKILTAQRGSILNGRDPADIDMWAVHPGGRSILDQIEQALDLAPERLAPARDVLRRFGNMSSATIMFVLKELMARPVGNGLGCGMAFGPGLTTESFAFSRADRAAP